PIENDIEKAELITSEVRGKPGIHAPVLDIDYPLIVIPSSTPGHNHLYIEKEIREPEYMALLAVLGAVGIVEPGYASVSQTRRWSAVRLSWIMKKRYRHGCSRSKNSSILMNIYVPLKYDYSGSVVVRGQNMTWVPKKFKTDKGYGWCLACEKWEHTMPFIHEGLLLNYCEWAYYDYFDL
ncbi:MAG: hypothetical protein ACREOB_12220, partial [Thermodesulfobacteriota bacterium]